MGSSEVKTTRKGGCLRRVSEVGFLRAANAFLRSTKKEELVATDPYSAR